MHARGWLAAPSVLLLLAALSACSEVGEDGGSEGDATQVPGTPGDGAEEMGAEGMRPEEMGPEERAAALAQKFGPFSQAEWIERLAHADKELVRLAVTSLGDAGSAAELAVPALIERAADRTESIAIRDAALVALGRIGSVEAIPKLTALVVENQVPLAERAGQILVELGPDAALPMAAELDNEKADVRFIAAQTVGSLVETYPRSELVEEALPALLRAIADEDPRVSLFASKSIALGRERFSKWVPELAKLLDGAASESSQESLLYVLSAMGPAARAALPAIEPHLDSRSLGVRLEAALAAAAAGEPERALSAIFSVLAEEDVDWQVDAAKALAQLGPAGAVAEKRVRALQEIASDSRVRDALQEALEAFEAE